MILDYVAGTQAFTLRVPRSNGELVQSLMREHGLDFSTSASTRGDAVLFTREPYAAASFAQYATPQAYGQLAGIVKEIESSWAPSSNGHFKCPADQELWPFQKATLEYALKRKNTLIGDQPGLGKTPTAICFANEISAKRVLVICPANIRLQWAKKIREWSTQRWPYEVYPILNSKRGVHPTAEWTIVSYDLARTEAIGKALAKGTYDLLILDEAHYLKTVDTRRTRAVFGGGSAPLFPALASRCGSILGLTGTPLPNRPREAYTLARGMCLGAATRVLTDSGEKPIVDVLATDKLWDGEQWVRHAGVVSKGTRPVLGTALEATAEHRVLAGTHWSTWQNVLANESTQSLALATGWESLQSLAMLQGKEAFASLCRAHADGHHTRPQPLTSAAGEVCGASGAATRCFLPLTPGAMTHPSSQIASCGSPSSAGSPTSSGDAKTQQTKAISGMAREASGFGLSGSETAPPSSGISPHCPTSERPDLNWIGLTTVRATSLGTCDGFPRRPTPATNEPSPLSLPELQNLKPVYDIVNAGPRQRFTVITDAGPLVVHNCWDAIDWASEDHFRDRFNPSMTRETIDRETGRTKIYIDERSGRHAELQNRLRGNFMVRHLKREVMTQLKMPVYDIVQLEETGAVKQALKAESLLDIDPENLEGADASVLGHVAVVRRMMGLALAPQVADYVDMLIDGGEEKLVLFGWHIEVLDILQKRLAKHGVIRIDGSTGANNKQRLVDKFIEDKGIQIILGNIQSMGTGTDGLQKVSCHALIAEPSWTPGENQQCADRLDRGGQNRSVQVDFFAAPNSFSEKVLSSALRKNQITHAALDRRVA